MLILVKEEHAATWNMQLLKTDRLPYGWQLPQRICRLSGNSDYWRQQARPNLRSLTENSFNTRFTNHKVYFTNPSKRLNTELSKHIWQLKDTKTDFRVS